MNDKKIKECGENINEETKIKNTSAKI